MARRFKIFSRCDGAAAVEFAIILPLLIFFILGGMDIGHMFYIDHLITTASREGARYGAKYTGNPPVTPSSTAISDYIIEPSTATEARLNYKNLHLDNLVVTSPPPVTVGLDNIITVTVTAHKHWWVLGSLTLFTNFGFHGFTNPQTRTATTSMKVEY